MHIKVARKKWTLEREYVTNGNKVYESGKCVGGVGTERTLSC